MRICISSSLSSLNLKRPLEKSTQGSKDSIQAPSFTVSLRKNKFITSVGTEEEVAPSLGQDVLHTKRFCFKNKFENPSGMNKLKSPHADRPYRSLSAHFLKEKSKGAETPEESKNRTVKKPAADLDRKYINRKRLSERLTFLKKNSNLGSPFGTDFEGTFPHQSFGSARLLQSQNPQLAKFPWSRKDKVLDKYADKGNQVMCSVRESVDKIPSPNLILMSQFVDYKKDESELRPKIKIKMGSQQKGIKTTRSKPVKITANK